jgi:hypothetical protein
MQAMVENISEEEMMLMAPELGKLSVMLSYATVSYQGR